MSKKVMLKDSLGNRMKGYENAYKETLPENFPIIIRLDGSHFHTFTKDLEKPFDENLISAFWETCKYLAENIGGAKFVYHQSDEISILVRNDDNYNTQAWFKNNLNKLVSISASLATAKFNEEIRKVYPGKELATFDSRVFIVPEHEILNYFVWRQNDAMRNSVSMVAQSMFSHKSLQNQKKDDMVKRMLVENHFDFFNDLEIYKQRGACFEKELFDLNLGNGDTVKRSRWEVNLNMPVLTEEKDFLNKFRK